MRIGNKLSKLIIFKEHECKAVEKYLEERALEGWLLEDISCGFFIFKKSKPKKYKFTVDIFTDLKTGEYIKYYESNGWKYAGETNKYLIFYTEDEKITTIQNDEDIIVKKVGKSMLLNVLVYICCAAYIGFIIYRNFIVDTLGTANNADIYGSYYLFLIIISCIFLICPILEIIRTSLWYFKYKKSLNLKKEIKYPTLKELKIRMTFFNLYIWMIGIVLICLVGDLDDSKAYIYTGLAVFAIIISMIKFIKITTSKDKILN